jgi:hypothetical protein
MIPGVRSRTASPGLPSILVAGMLSAGPSAEEASAKSAEATFSVEVEAGRWEGGRVKGC